VFHIKVLLENDYPSIELYIVFENINNRLKKIIMTNNNRKSVVNDNKIEEVQPSWFIVSFVILLRS